MHQIDNNSFTKLKNHLYLQNVTILIIGTLVLILCAGLILGLQQVLSQEKTNLRSDFNAHTNYLRKQELLLLQFRHQNLKVWELLKREINFPENNLQLFDFSDFKIDSQFDWKTPTEITESEYFAYQALSKYFADFYLSFWLNTVLPASPLVLIDQNSTIIFKIPADLKVHFAKLENLTDTNKVIWLPTLNQQNQALGIIHAGLNYDWYLVSIFKRNILNSSTVPIISKHKFLLFVDQQLIMGSFADQQILTNLNLTTSKLSFTKYGLAFCLEEGKYKAYYLINYTDFFDENLWLGISGLIVLIIFLASIIYYHNWLIKSVIGKAYADQKELIDAKQKADSANFAKSQFLAAMSHEIRTPLYGVIGGLELLEQSDLTVNQIQKVERIQKAAQLLNAQLTNILDLSKIEQGLMHLEVCAFNLTNLIDDCIKAFSALADKKLISLISQIDQNLPNIVIGDSGKLRQIISNLLSNALKFTAKNGQIIVSTQLLALTKTNCKVGFSVSDNGIGMLDSQLANLFVPIISHNGAGLGLSICQQLAQVMGTKIKVISKFKQGSKFSFDLVLDLENPNQITPNSYLANNNAQHIFIPLNLHILLVEDNPINYAVLSEQLAILGCSNQFAENANDALNLWQLGQFDVLITDVNLPDISGFALAFKIRQLSPNAKIIGLSANTLPEAKEQGLKSGMSAYCIKPILQAELYKQLVLVSGLLKPVASNLSAIFKSTMTDDLEQLDNAILANNLDEIKALLHRISGALAVADNSYLANCLHNLEQNFEFEKWQQSRFLLTLLINFENNYD